MLGFLVLSLLLLLIVLFCSGVAKQDVLNYAELLTLPFLEGKLAFNLVEDTIYVEYRMKFSFLNLPPKKGVIFESL